MKLRVIVIGICCLCMLTVHAQKTARDYVNLSSQLYVDGKNKEALQLAKRGLEVYDTDETLQKLIEILQKKDNSSKQNQNNNQDNDENNDNSDNSQDNSQGGSKGENSNKEQQDKSSGANEDNKNQNNEDKDKQNQSKTKEQSQSKPGEEGNEKYVKGQISENEAEMMLRAIENNEKAIQLKLQRQKQENQRKQKIEKNW